MSSVDVKPTSNRKPAGKADAPERAVQAGARVVHARAGASSRARDRLLGRQAVAGHLARKAPRRGCPSRRASPIRARPRSSAASPIRSRSASPATTTRSTAASRRRARRRARCSTRSSRRGSRRSARAACRAWPRTSTAMLDDRYHRSPFAEARTRDEAPLEDAVAMLARERLTGLEAAARRGASGRALAPLYRGQGRRRSRPARATLILDQRAYARLVRKLLSSLGHRERIRRRRRRIGGGDGGQDAARGRRRG